MQVNCEQCGRSFRRKPEDTWRKYCSKECTPPKKEEIKCESCGKSFSRKPEDTWRKYCSKECTPPKKEEIKCDKCGKSFSRKPEDTWRKYCSKECTPPKKEEIKCESCGKSFSRKPEDTWRKFCSKECSVQRLACKRCGSSFIKNRHEPWMVCCSQNCFDLLLVSKKCDRCGQDFQVMNAERWKRLCGRSGCFEIAHEGATSRATKPFSVKAIIWLEQIAQQEKINIRHAKNGGEHTISMGDSFIRFDGFCASNNTVYEFHGDYWHGNPKLYNPEAMNKDTGCTFGELYEKTIQRENFIRSEGYQLVTIWESEFDKL